MNKYDLKELNKIKSEIKSINTKRHKILPKIKNLNASIKQIEEFHEMGRRRSQLKNKKNRLMAKYNKNVVRIDQSA